VTSPEVSHAWLAGGHYKVTFRHLRTPWRPSRLWAPPKHQPVKHHQPPNADAFHRAGQVSKSGELLRWYDPEARSTRLLLVTTGLNLLLHVDQSPESRYLAPHRTEARNQVTVLTADCRLFAPTPSPSIMDLRIEQEPVNERVGGEIYRRDTNP
jgi:hypothetical protein